MKNKLFKLMAVFLAITVLLCCFTSCTAKKDDEEPSVTKPPEIEKPDENLVNFDDYTLPGDEETTDEEQSSSGTGETTTKNNSTVTPGSPNSSSSNSETTTSASSGLTKADMISLLNAAGYVYDEEQDMYYTHLNPWQRQFGFTSEYDTAASYLNMEYTTFKCDFTYAGKMWRIQCWKGQYALLCGAEMGVYTKQAGTSGDFYACADDDDLLMMGFDFYKTTKDYNAGKKFFYRPLEYHWWQTGFKFGYANSKNCVAVMTLYAKDSAMADGIEKGLKNVKDNKGKLNAFVPYGPEAKGKLNIYQRKGNEFKIIWVTAGYENYSGSML